MNWTNFLVILTLLYLTYYGLNLLYDLFKDRRTVRDDSDDEFLFFDENIKPQLIVPEDSPEVDFVELQNQSLDVETDSHINNTAIVHVSESSNLIESTGAVRLNELFNLAKSNLIEYTGTISY